MLEGQGRVVAHATGEAVIFGGQVVVAVNHAGHEGHAGNVQHFGAGRKVNGQAGADGDDARAVDEDGGVFDYRATSTVNEICTYQSFHQRTSGPAVGFQLFG